MSAEPLLTAPPRLPAGDAPRILALRVVVATGALAVVAGGICLTLLMTTPYRDTTDIGAWLIQLAAYLFTIGVGLIAWRARPGNRVGLLLVLTGFASLVPFLSTSDNGLLWTVGDMWNTAGTVVLANVYLAFPDGRTVGWSRRLLIAVYAWFLVATVGLRLLTPYPASWPFANPFLVWPNQQLAPALQPVANLVALALTFLVIGTVLDKWRRGSPVARRALAPVFWVSPVTLVVVGTYFLARAVGSDLLFSISTGPVASLWNFLLPVAFLIGLLQTQLHRASIADLVRELDGVATSDLEAALGRAVHDPSLRLAFPAPDGPGYVDSEGRPVEVPAQDAARDVTHVRAGDDTLALLIHDEAVDPALVESAAAASRLTLDNARLAAALRAQLEEVRASRARIVEATDEGRRRLERDLHDGAQQRLVALGFALRQARRRAEADPALLTVLDEAAQELERGLRELRELARGIHPTALADGVAPAIRSLADSSPIPVVVELDDRRLPDRIETSAYFIVTEALTNVLKHSGASGVTIRAHVSDGGLNLEIRDDGEGGADQADGSGVRGLRDRAQAVGGTLSIESPPGGGTLVRAWLPVE